MEQSLYEINAPKKAKYPLKEFKPQGLFESHFTPQKIASIEPYQPKKYRQNEVSLYESEQKKKASLDPEILASLVENSKEYIQKVYPNLSNLNIKNVGFSKQLDEKSMFFVIKSFSEEDVHKAIKYGVWASTKSGNQTLDNAFNITCEQGGEVYLFFSPNGSGRFVGVAKMTSGIDLNKVFVYWTQDRKWSGMIEIEWVFVKDVPFKMFDNIEIMMKDGQRKKVKNSRDTQEVPFLEAVTMIKIFEDFILKIMKKKP